MSRPFLLGFILALLGAACAPEGNASDYGAKVSYKKNEPVRFADFVLTYLGERRVTSDRYPRGFLFHDFRVAAAAGAQDVSWSSGTGDFGPAPFQVGAKRFTLELSRSDKLGPLKKDELVVNRLP